MTYVTTYAEFVASRAKRMGSLGADLHHAATGIMGEAVELRNAQNREHLCEELGDLAFYAMHFKLAWSWHGANAPAWGHAPEPAVGHAFDSLIDAAGDLLDQTKKLWVYNKVPDQKVYLNLYYILGRLSVATEVIHEAVEYTQEQAVTDNQRKLELRYPTGYSDAAAQARADKSEGE